MVEELRLLLIPRVQRRIQALKSATAVGFGLFALALGLVWAAYWQAGRFAAEAYWASLNQANLALSVTNLARARALAPDEFPPPVEITIAEMAAEIRRAVAALPPEARTKAALVPITVADVPDSADLAASDPPFPPTILGLFRGLPLGESPAPGEHPPARAIVLYRMNLARAVRSRAELTEQIDRTIRHELGHLDGLDEDDLRRRDLE